MYSTTAAISKLIGRAETELRSDKMADPKGMDFPSLTIWMPEVNLFAVANRNAPSAFP
jgi:hypothetical protein